MPDWFYRTLAQPALFVLPDALARQFALNVIGTLGRVAAGRVVIDFLGHMRPDHRLGVEHGGTHFPSPIGIGWRVDPELRATRALAHFGAGFIELAPDAKSSVRRCNDETLVSLSLSETSTPGHSPHKNFPIPILNRQTDANNQASLLLPNGKSWPILPWNSSPELQSSETGIVLEVGHSSTNAEGKTLWLAATRPPADLCAKVAFWRNKLPSSATLVVSGGVSEPADALALFAAGADLILIEAGLVFRGPGLIKRCNEALLQTRLGKARTTDRETRFRQASFWAAALGLSMFAGGLLTLSLALTRVLLPYDEHYLGLSAKQLHAIAPQLLTFMEHDRATLAWTMLAIGILYFSFARFGVARGQHWAHVALIASALTGFASFFSFLGFGYFDPFHAFVTLALLQLLLMAMSGQTTDTSSHAHDIPDLHEDAPWRASQWGQLLFVVHAHGLLIAGCVILYIGMTSVFVREDLEFLCATRDEITVWGERILAVVAHDRATLGGMLLANGLAMLLAALWGFRRGRRWLWHALLLAGACAYVSAIGTHLHVGYTDWLHLLPALVGFMLFAGGLALSRGFLCAH